MSKRGRTTRHCPPFLNFDFVIAHYCYVSCEQRPLRNGILQVRHCLRRGEIWRKLGEEMKGEWAEKQEGHPEETAL